jgi:phosphoribosylglycinamide formyltransferase-1
VNTPSRQIVVMASGTGSLLASLLEAADRPDFPARIAAVITDRECRARDLADDRGIATAVVALRAYPDRATWGKALLAEVSGHRPDFIVAAGFMKILDSEFIAEYRNKIINAHPALLPSFPGAHAVADALAHGVRVTGSTIHLVDDGVDTGPILAQEPVIIRPDDDEQTLHERIKEVERELLVQVVTDFATKSIDIQGRKARLL